MTHKISIVGMGRVGSTLAYTLMLKELATDLVLVNRTASKSIGDALDLQDGHLFLDHRIKISAGEVADTRDSDLIALCVSEPSVTKPASRLDLAYANVRLLQDLVPRLAKLSPTAKFIVLSNPVDVLTYYTIRFSELPPNRIIGTGTLLDSARFRDELSNELGIHPADLRAYILGEHGDSQFPVFSTAQAGGQPLKATEQRWKLFAKTVRSGYEVLQHKGYTNYAVAMAAGSIIENIVHDSRHTMPVSTLIEGYLGVQDVCLSVPAVIGSEGIVRKLEPELDEEEEAAFRRSASAVRQVIQDTAGPSLQRGSACHG